jgi:ubiquinone/menaquinone biosynthesis C-methylase UbiE
MTAAATLARRIRKAVHYSTDEVTFALSRAVGADMRIVFLVGRVKARPQDFFRWSDLALAIYPADHEAIQLISNHRLRRSHIYLIRAEEALHPLAAPGLSALAERLSPETAGTLVLEAIREIVRWKTVWNCREDFNTAINYFDDAETHMDTQWRGVIWPIIHDCDFTHVLEIGCGQGRNAAFYSRLAKRVTLIDVNEIALEGCRRRFAATPGCSFAFVLTRGNKLDGVADGSVSLVYCWDTMVHFDRLIVRDYMREIARVLKPGGHAFLHYSNLGEALPFSDFAQNHAGRSNMHQGLMLDYASENGLSPEVHRMSGRQDGWGHDGDFITLLRR